jgi:DNA-directed RNA polymerase specialized sigma24 family protein
MSQSLDHSTGYVRSRSPVVVPFPVPNSDVGLVAALRVDHPGARRALCDRYSGELLEVATRILGPDARVESIVIETLRWSLARLDELTDPRLLRTWLLSRVIVLATQGVQARRPWGWLSGAHTDREFGKACCSEQLMSTYRVLDRMDIDKRVVFCLVAIHSMGLAEVAAVLGASLLAVKGTLAGAHAQFHRLVRSREPGLARWCSSHASLGVKVAGELDRVLGCGHIFEFDLLRRRDRMRQRWFLRTKQMPWFLALALLLVALAGATTVLVVYLQRA